MSRLVDLMFSPSGCDYTTEIVCPHCMHEHEDSWEWSEGTEGDFDGECRKCGKAFQVTRYFEYRYQTRKELSDLPGEDEVCGCPHGYKKGSCGDCGG